MINQQLHPQSYAMMPGTQDFGHAPEQIFMDNQGCCKKQLPDAFYAVMTAESLAICDTPDRLFTAITRRRMAVCCIIASDDLHF